MHHKLYIWSFVLLGSMTFLYVQGQFSQSDVSERLAFLMPSGMTAAVSSALDGVDTAYKSREEYAAEGFFIRDFKVGTGAVTENGKKLTVHFSVETPDGEILRTTKNDEPYTFVLGRGQVIEGFDIGLQDMRAGGVRTLVIPPAYAYGEKRFAGLPEDTALVFTIDLIKVD